MLAERLEEWAHEYEAKGEARGEARGEALALQKLLIKRFGAIPSDVLAMIGTATTAQVDAWLDQILEARSLDDLFGASRH